MQGKDCQLEGRKFQFLITSYNFVPKLKDQLQTLAPQVMVLDEAHSIKASKASPDCEPCPKCVPMQTETVRHMHTMQTFVGHLRARDGRLKPPVKLCPLPNVG